MQRVFVVWDFSDAISITLEGLRKRPPAGMEIEVPGVDSRGGSILENVSASIAAADRVLVVTDRPNANVGFEAGLALGLGKPTLFAFGGKNLPPWVSTPPLRNYLQFHFDNVVELRDLLQQPNCWVELAKPAPVTADGECCFLCPQAGEGTTFREERADEWGQWRPPPEQLLLSELDQTLGGAARLVWTIASYPENADERDGAENAANAIIAGWFYSRCLELEKSSRETRFRVLRHARSRRVVDIELYEQVFAQLEEYGRLLRAAEESWGQEQRKARVLGVVEGVDRLEQHAVRAKLLPLVVASLRRDFTDVHEGIARVNYYKRIHDSLHQIQFLCYLPLVHNVFAARGATDLGGLRPIRSDLEVQIAELAGITPALPIEVEAPTWTIERLRRCVAELDAAIERNEPASLTRAIDELVRVMDRSPVVFGSLLTAAAKGLRVRRLVDALLALREEPSGVLAAADIVEPLASDLRALEGEQSSLIERHGRWEEVEACLKMIDAALKDVSAESINDEDILELRTEWEFLRREAVELVGLGADALAGNLKQEAQRVDRALETKDPTGCRHTYFGFRNIAAKAFFKVDTSLKDLLAKLSLIGVRLDSFLLAVEKTGG